MFTTKQAEELEQAILSRLSYFLWDSIDADVLAKMQHIAEDVLRERTKGMLGPNEHVGVNLSYDEFSGNLVVEPYRYEARSPEEQAAMERMLSGEPELFVETEDHIADAGKLVSPEPVADHVVDANKMVQDFMWRNSFGNKLLKAALLHAAGLLKIEAAVDESKGTVTVTFKRRDTKP